MSGDLGGQGMSPPRSITNSVSDEGERHLVRRWCLLVDFIIIVEQQISPTYPQEWSVVIFLVKKKGPINLLLDTVHQTFIFQLFLVCSW